DNTFTPDAITGTNGNLTIDANGHWTFTANSAFNQLNVGDKVEETFTVSSVDGTPSTIKVTINGTNDAPTINAQAHSVTEGGSVLHGQMVGQDIDTSATLTYSTPQIDGLLMNPDGSYNFNPSHSAYQSLASGVTKTLTIPVTVTDEHNASNTQNLSITITGVNNSAKITGVDTGEVHEGSAYTAPDGSTSGTSVDDRSPDHAHGNIAELSNALIHTEGHLTIVDADAGESHAQNGTYQGTHGQVIMQSNGDWSYYASIGQTATGRAIDHLGKEESLTDTITVQSADGTTHDIHITIHGDNDRPYCSSEVQLNSGKEDQTQTFTTAQLLANTVDVDHNDAGKLTLSNLHADYGTVLDNKDGTFTFTPNANYNGKVHFTYDVVDAHGGTTHTGATTTLTPTDDKAIITEVNTENVTEDGSNSTHNRGVTTELAHGALQVVDPDSGQDKFQYSAFGERAIHDPFGGMLRIDSAGGWGYSVDNARLQHLAQGQVETVVYRVYSYDGTPYDLHIDVLGTNDAPTATKVVLTNGTEDTQYQMQASQFGFSDIDTGDTLHVISITDLPPAAQGKFVLDGHDIHAGQAIAAANINKLQFVPAPNFNGDVAFKYTVNDGHTDSTETQNTLHIDAVADAATFTGDDTGEVHEGSAYTAPDGSTGGTSVDDRSPDHAHGNIAELSNALIHTEGHLTIVDADTGESHAKNGTYQGTHGQVIMQSNGDWSYYASIGQTATGRAIDHLGKGESLTDTITVQSADGTTHDIHITIHGDNDRPYCSSEVQLNSGKEDQTQTFTTAQLLANTVDVDHNDAGKLTLSNLHADYGTVLDNKDGTFTFTPNANYSGKVHFTYDVVDAHGGTTHTGATTTLTPTDDKAIITEITTGSVTEDGAYSTHNRGVTTEIAHGALQVVDPDSGQDKFQYSAYGERAIHDPFGGMLRISSSGGWGYSVDNARLQHLAQGQVETVIYRVYSYDGTPYDLHIDVVGTNDAPTATKVVLTNGTEDTQYQMQASQFGFSDIDAGDTLHAISITDLPPATQGKFVLDGHDIHAGQAIAAADISKLQFVPAPDFNGDVAFKYTVNDGHTDSTETQSTLHIDAVADAATFTGDDTGEVHEGRAYTAPDGSTSGTSVDDRSPDHVHGNIAELSNALIHTEGHLTIVDADAGESHTQNGTYQGTHGQVIMQSNGDWSYYASIGQTATGRAIDHLGKGESLTDTITVQSADGTTHDIHITIHGDNDRPYCSSEVQLNSGKEDQTQTFTTAQLLANTVDVDHNDAGKLTLSNLHADHGTVLDNKDGTFTFTPDHNYNGQVHFTYDVVDAHGGMTHSRANINLTAVRDAATFTGDDTGAVKEDTGISRSGRIDQLVASGTLAIHDPDGPQEEFFDFKSWGEHAISDPFGGNLHISQAGSWAYVVDNNNPALQALKEGETRDVVYRVTSRDYSTHEITITVTGTNDVPTAAKVVLTNGTEDTQYQMQASQFGFSDIDTGDTLHAISITDLPPAAQGKFVLDGHDIHAGQTIAATDIIKLQFVPAPDFNGDVAFKYTVNDGHTDSAETQNTLHIDAVADAATFTGGDTGETHEGSAYTAPDGSTSGTSVDDRSPDHAHGNIAELSNDLIHTEGHLTIVDADTWESHAQSGTYQGAHGQVIMQSNGDWSYYASIGQTATGRAIDHLGKGESLTDTITVKSADGTTHDIHITIHGDNDRPYCSSEVQLNSGKEAQSQTFTATELLANTIDVDSNDLGKLTVANLHVDHGSILDNQDGTYTFTPTKDYNGQVHFTYDVQDAHGGVTHTGASITLAAVNDAATFTGDAGSIDEDTNLQHNVNVPGSSPVQDALICNGHLVISDVDGQGEAALDLKGQPQISQDGTYGHFTITPSGAWTYTADNTSTPIQDLDSGQTLTDSIEITSKDGTKHSITVTINGTTDDPILHTLSDSGVQHSGTIEGNLISGAGTHEGVSGAATDTDSNAHLVLQDIQIKDPIAGYVTVTLGHPHSMTGIGTLAIEADGHYTFTPDAGFTGTVPSMVYRVGDTGSNSRNDSSQNSLTIEVNPSVQHTPVQHDEPSSPLTFEASVTIVEDSNDPNEQHVSASATDSQHHDVSHHGAAAYLDALGIKPDATSTTVDDQPADIDIVLAQVDQQDAATHDQAHLDMSDALEHHDANINHNQDDEHHHHNDIDGLPDIDPNS
ncbi:TPA: VCBS domain-containing protein, partial [Vibrio alginolyticus]